MIASLLDVLAPFFRTDQFVFGDQLLESAAVEAIEFDGVIKHVRIGQEGNWLVLRPTNPLGVMNLLNCQFFRIGEPELGLDDDGPYVRWQLHDASFLP